MLGWRVYILVALVDIVNYTPKRSVRFSPYPLISAHMRLPVTNTVVYGVWNITFGYLIIWWVQNDISMGSLFVVISFSMKLFYFILYSIGLVPLLFDLCEPLIYSLLWYLLKMYFLSLSFVHLFSDSFCYTENFTFL